MKPYVGGRHPDSIPVPGCSSPWLSILVPVYNVGPYLRECVDSIVSQLDDEGVEIVLLDDASTDVSRQICEQICEEYGANVRLFVHSCNRGLSAARNSLLDVAHGRYIWFLDSDDKLLPTALAKLRDIVEVNAPDIVLCDYSKKKRKRWSTFAGEVGRLQHDREALVRGVFACRRMQIWSKISKRELWGDDLRFPAGRYFEDIAVTPWLLLRARSYYYVPEAWVYYRIRPGSILSSLSQSPKLFDDRKNADLAEALGGYSRLLKQELPHSGRQTLYYITRFYGIEFRKIGMRLVRARWRRDGWPSVSSQLYHYLEKMQGSVPFSFSQLGKEYLRRFKFGSWALLQVFLLLARPDDYVL